MPSSWAVGIGKRESDLWAGLLLHGQQWGLMWDRCIDGSKAICRVSNVMRSSSPNPRR